MINGIIDGISIKLYQEFGDGYEIYSEEIKQGLIEPCFFIAFLRYGQTQIIGQRYFKEHFFDIHYFPVSTQDKNFELNEVAEELTDALEYITVNGDLVRGTNLNGEIVDGVLHFFVNYNMHVYKAKDPIPHMGDLKIFPRTKRGGG
ncbi:phage tail terminator family protein [Cytobacillus massiliigabonensis]|uniref:phage tail terminator family protein n=1 Tax=Cytobacillus massiliigabonensis TaxID=1871011 RepID=UPI000C830171|nr:hypothetical protein [Cytobacillus massiliigabonensis]